MNATQETIDRLKERAAQEAEGEEDVTPAVDSPDPEKPKRESIREYVILTGWTEIARVVAGTPDAAILSLGENLKDGTKYAATPSRNWHEKTPETETTVSIKLK